MHLLLYPLLLLHVYYGVTFTSYMACFIHNQVELNIILYFASQVGIVEVACLLLQESSTLVAAGLHGPTSDVEVWDIGSRRLQWR